MFKPPLYHPSSTVATSMFCWPGKDLGVAMVSWHHILCGGLLISNCQIRLGRVKWSTVYWLFCSFGLRFLRFFMHSDCRHLMNLKCEKFASVFMSLKLEGSHHIPLKFALTTLINSSFESWFQPAPEKVCLIQVTTLDSHKFVHVALVVIV